MLRFLEKISILDLVCAELADAVTGDEDGAAMLAELSSSNLFVQSVGEGGRWFRLQGFVSDVLRSRMVEPRARRDLHRRAAEWYRRRSLPEAAIRLALAGGLLPLAAELVGVHDVGLVLRGRGRELDTMLAAVPRDALLAHPELAAGLAGARMVYGHDEELADLVGAAEARLDALAEPRARRVRLVLDLIAIADARLRGDLDGLAAACRRIPLDPGELAELGLAGWDLVRVLTLSNQGTAELWLGEVDAAEVHLRAAMEAEPAAGIVLPRINAQAQLALLDCVRGHLTSARTEASQVIARATATGAAPTVQVASAYLALAWAYLDSGELSEADPWLRRADEVEAAAPEPHVQLTVAVLRALRRAEADPEAALLGLQTRTPSTGPVGRAGEAPRPQPARAGRARGAAPRSGAGEVRAGGTALARHPGGRRRPGRACTCSRAIPTVPSSSSPASAAGRRRCGRRSPSTSSGPSRPRPGATTSRPCARSTARCAPRHRTTCVGPSRSAPTVCAVC